MPVAKIAATINFLLIGMCNFQIGAKGMTRIAKSDIILKMPVAIGGALVLKQWPLVISNTVLAR